MVGAMAWSDVFGLSVICWLVIALTVGTIVGHGIALGTSSDPG